MRLLGREMDGSVTKCVRTLIEEPVEFESGDEIFRFCHFVKGLGELTSRQEIYKERVRGRESCGVRFTAFGFLSRRLGKLGWCGGVSALPLLKSYPAGSVRARALQLIVVVVILITQHCGGVHRC